MNELLRERIYYNRFAFWCDASMARIVCCVPLSVEMGEEGGGVQRVIKNSARNTVDREMAAAEEQPPTSVVLTLITWHHLQAQISQR